MEAVDVEAAESISQSRFANQVFVDTKGKDKYKAEILGNLRNQVDRVRNQASLLPADTLNVLLEPCDTTTESGALEDSFETVHPGDGSVNQLPPLAAQQFVAVTNVLGKSEQGRVFPAQGIGALSFSKPVRHLIFSRFCADIDMNNSFVAVFAAMVTLAGEKEEYPAVLNYRDERAKVLASIVKCGRLCGKSNDVSKEEGKSFFIHLLFLADFYYEVQTLFGLQPGFNEQTLQTLLDNVETNHGLEDRYEVEQLFEYGKTFQGTWYGL